MVDYDCYDNDEDEGENNEEDDCDDKYEGRRWVQ